MKTIRLQKEKPQVVSKKKTSVFFIRINMQSTRNKQESVFYLMHKTKRGQVTMITLNAALTEAEAAQERRSEACEAGRGMTTGTLFLLRCDVKRSSFRLVDDALNDRENLPAKRRNFCSRA